MTVRREIVETRRETGVRSPEAPIRTRALQGGSEGEPALRRLVGTHGVASCNLTLAAIFLFKVGLVHPYVRASITHHK